MKSLIAILLSLSLCMMLLLTGCSAKQPAAVPEPAPESKSEAKPESESGTGIFTMTIGHVPDQIDVLHYNGDAELYYRDDGSLFAELGYSAAKVRLQPENEATYAAEQQTAVDEIARALEDFLLLPDQKEPVTDNKTPLPSGDYMNFSFGCKELNGDQELIIYASGEVHYSGTDPNSDELHLRCKALDDTQYPKLQAALQNTWDKLDALPLTYQIDGFGCYPDLFVPESTALRMCFDNRGALPIACSAADFVLEKQAGSNWEPLTRKTPATEVFTAPAQGTLWFTLNLNDFQDGRLEGKYRVRGKAVTSRESLEIIAEYEISRNAGEKSNPFQPEMTPENQEYCDKYLNWSVFTPFDKSFDEAHPLTWVDANLMFFTIASEEGTFEESYKTYPDAFPAELVESTIQSRFMITSEQIKASLPVKAEGLTEYYDPAAQTYTFEIGYGSAVSPIVTDAVENGDLLTLTCDWYNISDECIITSEITIQTETDGAYRYIANKAYHKDAT